MTKQEYLESILSKNQIKEIERAIKNGSPVFIGGENQATGKSSLMQFLRIAYREHNPQVYDLSEKNMQTVIYLNQPLTEQIPDIIGKIDDITTKKPQPRYDGKYNVLSLPSNPRDCCPEYKCPVCGERFNGYLINHNDAHCPNAACNVKLCDPGNF
ncbi:MAG: hypothetical protein K0R00_72 [Herbinix sp.]|jgi:hypothetical protein|nr:hypothetical protein [Herbinix sp.]